MLTLIFGCNHAFSEQGLFSYLGRDIWLITANQDANFDVSKVRFFFCYLSKEGIFFPKAILGRHINFYPFVTWQREQGAMIKFLSYLLGAPLKTPSLITTVFAPKQEIAALFHSSQGRQQGRVYEL